MEVREIARSLPLHSVTSVILRVRLDFTVIIVLEECGNSCSMAAIADVGPGTAKPRKSSIDLYSDSVFRFLARIHSYVINRTRNKTIKEARSNTGCSCVGFAGVPTERLLDKHVLSKFIRENRGERV